MEPGRQAMSDLSREIAAARRLKDQFAELIQDDEAFANALVEAETNLNEAIQAACSLYAQDKTACAAIEEHIKQMETRKARLQKRMEHTRVLVAVAMEEAGCRKIETAIGTVSLKATPISVIVDEEKKADIPTKFWKRGAPTLDKKMLKEALESGEDISGARLSNGGQTVAFRFD